MIEPYPAYKRLNDLFKLHEDQGAEHLHYLSGQYLADLLVWYHLAWTGESVRREHELVVSMMSKGCMFTYKDRQQLFALIGELIPGIIPRYRKLAEDGQVEISTTPHYHPIAPLLLDFKSARESVPEIDLPLSPCYPGGQAALVISHRRRAEVARAVFWRHGRKGMWPAEGGVSQAAALLMAQNGCRWIATGQKVLSNSLHPAARGESPADPLNYLYRPYRVSDGQNEIACFFRDDRLVGQDRLRVCEVVWPRCRGEFRSFPGGNLAAEQRP